MRERHPIDELFRHGLERAEFTPPSGVWKGVLRERSWGHRQLLLLRRRWPLVALLFLGAGGGVWYSAQPPAREVASGADAPVEVLRATIPNAHTTTSLGNAVDVSKGAYPSDVASKAASELGAAAPPHSLATTSPTAPHAQARGSDAVPDDPTPSAPFPSQQLDPRLPVEASAIGKRGALVADRIVAPVGPLTSADRAGAGDLLEPAAPSSLSAIDPLKMTPWAIALERSTPTPVVRSATQEEYVVAHGSWWIATAVGLFSTERRWSGEDEKLVTAWDEAERKKRDLLYGLHFGRAWRSGLWCGAGVEFGKGRSSFDRMDQRQDLTMEVTTQLATFDEMVIAVVTDSTVIVEERSETFTGTNRSSVLRLPLLAGWSWGQRRWALGVHVGLAGEWHTLRDGYVLVTSANDAGAETLTTEELPEKDRSYGLLSAQVGLSAGFLINEHWGVCAGPGYQSGLILFSSRAPLQALPSRLGGTVQLTYTLPSRTR